ncbi:MAG: hypothetical protein J7L71_02350 [Spirochaetaceae bacterium]|nr:hypothetical protein [Spirochaetaceae bacterium]
MDKIDFNSDEWKEKLKGKSPEEIAKIVGNYYEEKYKDITEFDKKRVIGWIVFLVIVIAGLLFVFSYLKSLSRNI